MEVTNTQRCPKAKKSPRFKSLAPSAEPASGSGSEGEDAEAPLLPSQLLAEPQEAEQQREDQQRKEHIQRLCGGDAETLIRNIRELLTEKKDSMMSLEVGEWAVSGTQVPAPSKPPASKPLRKMAPKQAAPPAGTMPSPSPASQQVPETQEPAVSQGAGSTTAPKTSCEQPCGTSEATTIPASNARATDGIPFRQAFFCTVNRYLHPDPAHLTVTLNLHRKQAWAPGVGCPSAAITQLPACIDSVTPALADAGLGPS